MLVCLAGGLLRIYKDLILAGQVFFNTFNADLSCYLMRLEFKRHISSSSYHIGMLATSILAMRTLMMWKLMKMNDQSLPTNWISGCWLSSMK